ncbi:kinase domain protein [Necator americanus]|uniref:Kinase domain protein n=1 Tax=Necator americanus TaxID=51031 RepID=W2T2Z0_NECAM|nr:kinase domain protein [Necator americanus]ETN75337.1 kinase domain protein [Necator americanus]
MEQDEESSTFNTQPADENSFDPSSSCSSTSSSNAQAPYAKLQPLQYLVPTIGEHSWGNELRNDTFICGRGMPGEVDFDFSTLREKHRIYNIISKQHFRLNRVDGSTVLTDLSFNGTFVNEKLVVFLYEERGREIYPAALSERYIMTDTSLGKGGYGVVLLAKLRQNCQVQVAVKILDTTQLSRRFSRALSKAKDVEKEVAIMLQINHPNCVKFMDWIETEHKAYIVMEMVGGGELFDRIVDPKWNGMGFGEDLCKFYGCQLLSALEHLHGLGITHRDIKPENILCMTKDDYTVVKLADFGLAKEGGGSTMKSFCGTPAYMAPELIDNEKLAYTPRVDMWSLGVVLFTGICGYPPFSDDYPDMDLHSQIKKGRLIFHNQWKYVTLETQDVIKRMLKVDPTLRLSACDALKKSWLHNSVEVSKAKVLVEKYLQTKRALECVPILGQ